MSADKESAFAISCIGLISFFTASPRYHLCRVFIQYIRFVPWFITSAGGQVPSELQLRRDGIQRQDLPDVGRAQRRLCAAVHRPYRQRVLSGHVARWSIYGVWRYAFPARQLQFVSIVLLRLSKRTVLSRHNTS